MKVETIKLEERIALKVIGEVNSRNDLGAHDVLIKWRGRIEKGCQQVEKDWMSIELSEETEDKKEE